MMGFAHKYRVEIESFARAFVCENPNLGISVDDVIGEGWVCALESKRKWKEKGGTSFSSYLYRRLEWLRFEMIGRCLKEQKLKSRYSQTFCHLSSMDFGDQILVKAASKLRPKERRLLGLLVCPPAEFIQRKNHGSRIGARQYAEHLDCSVTAVRWYVSRIKNVLGEML